MSPCSNPSWRTERRSIELDDLLGELATQDVVALLADADDLDRLALGHEPVGMVAGQTRDGGVERAAQTALGGAHDQQVNPVGPGAGQKTRRLRAHGDAGREIAEHHGHALRIGTGGLRRGLRPAQLRGGHHLHGLGDLLRRLDRGDAVTKVFQARHRAALPLRRPGI
jgi:hypothetical protein